MAHLCLLLLIWVLPAIGLRAQHLQHPSEQLDLAGEWQVNESLSDEVPLLPGEAMALARAEGLVRTGTRKARSVHGPDPLGVTKVRNVLRTTIHAAARLKIVQTGGTVAVTDAEGRTMLLIPDGRETRLEQDGVRFTLVARWKAPLLTIEREYEDGTTMSESFASFDQPRQLVATTTIHNGRMAGDPMTLTRVYEVVGEGDGLPH
jgi:hypothetical protein